MEKVLWHEGMMLLPQHFQQQDRYLAHQIHLYANTLRNQKFGLFCLEYDQSLLERGDVLILKCLAILPDGTLIDIPNKDTSPPIMKLTNFKEEVISIGVLIEKPGLPQAYLNSDKDRKTRFQAKEKTVTDNYEDIHQPDRTATLLLAALSLSLLKENALQGYSSLPLFKASIDRDSGKAIINDRYLPPTFNCYAFSSLSAALLKLENEIHFQSKSISEKINQKKLSTYDEFLEFQALSVLNRYKSTLSFQNIIKNINPETLYAFLYSFLHELSTYRDKHKQISDKPRYQYQDLSESFFPLIEKIMDYLTFKKVESTRTLPIKKLSDYVFQFSLPGDEEEKNYQYIGCLKSNKILDDHVKLLHHIKASPSSLIQDLIYRSLPGIPLSNLLHLPKEIPHASNCFYFSIDKKNILWQQAASDKKISVFIDDKSEIHALEIFAIQKE